jgi:hypothetical protein
MEATMTIRSGLVVLLKCFMILLGVNLLMWLLGTAGGGRIPLAFVAVASLGLIPLLLIYWFAESIVDFMTPKSNETFAEPALRFGDLQAIAFSMVGVYILYNAIRETITLVVYLWASKDSLAPITIPPDIYLAPIASWLIGLYLLVGAPQLRRWLVSLRRANPGVE